jgi:ribosome biogenesis GTPase
MVRLLAEESTSAISGAHPMGSRATVVSIGPRHCEVALGDSIVSCPLSPDIAERQQTEIAVGDDVLLENRGSASVVVGVLPRRTKLSRPDAGNANLERVIVANVDVVVVVVSVVSPPLHPRLIDRYLIAIQRGGAKPVIAVNKLDLCASDEELAEAERQLKPYQCLGIPIVLCSANEGRGREELLQALSGQMSAFVGHSGVGKSSLLNMVCPELSLQVGAVSRGQGRGTHTTTRSSLRDLGEGTRVIDTPGIRSFGLWNLEEADLPWYFPEFAALGRCKFGDCTHTHEPGCRVKSALETGAVSAERYDTYIRIRSTLAP